MPAVLLLGPVLTFTAPVQAQNSVTASARPAISVLDSTKEQDGLVGSVRRVKTETARIELRDGRPVEGSPQLTEITTYGIKGNRIENTSYPIAGSLVGKEEYKYDERGNITEMTLRDEHGAILSREAYSYEFDKFGNWTRMVTSLVVFENGALKREPIEVTYRTFTYYFDDNVAKAVEEPVIKTADTVPGPVLREVEGTRILEIDYDEDPISSPDISESPPPLVLNTAPAPAPVISTPAPVSVQPPASEANKLYLSGRDRFEAGDVNGAVEAYLQSIKLEPKSAEVFFNLAYAYLKLEKDNDAVKAFKQSLKLNPDKPETQYGLGLASFRMKRFQDAADAFKKAILLNPKMAKAHYGLSLAYQELGDTRGVVEQYRILETLDKNLARKLLETFPKYNFSCRGLLRGCP
ncbi:MAG TPA: tetratricopeptide repeat protein [Pyrinomonadaceae bacterium]|nr:tetratricopeptide repeat protein [Pyrinomonadaceae bacterium]